MLRSLALVCDPDALRRRDVRAALASEGCVVTDVFQLASIGDPAADPRPDLAVIAITPALSSEAFGAIARLREVDRRLPVILIVRESSETLAVEALRAGVKDYFSGPIDRAALAAAVRRCLADRRPSHRPAKTSAPDGRSAGSGRDPLIASTSAMRAVCEYLDRVAQNDATVLITGETGTGKELAARWVHDKSRRRSGRFVSVNCAAIPEGLLESELFGHEPGAFTGASRSREGLLQLADRGTVFLDEIGDLGAAAQAKILRAIETREIYRLGGCRPIPLDVRVVAATNQDLERAVDDGRFRKDLYFRLNVARVHLPPLRERRADIPAIINHYLRAMNSGARPSIERFAPQTLEALVAYDWPGNVRELKNLIESVLVAPPAGCIRIEDLPSGFRERLARYRGLPEAERARLMDALLAADWNKSRAAEMLQWSRMTLYRKMAKYSVASASPSGRITIRHR